jgi:glycosyltransferase involved in cell wall biosynthesis
MNGGSKQRWRCFQKGAREHYAIPRALVRQDVLEELVTDIWARRSTFHQLFPANLKRLLSTRFHTELGESSVKAFNAKALCSEFVGRFSAAGPWEKIIQRNDWFQHYAVQKSKLVNKADNGLTHVFAYSYAAREIFAQARSNGIKTVLGQIDPGPEEIKRVHAIEDQLQAPRTLAPPETYWDAWRQECQLADVVLCNSNWSRSLLLEDGVEDQKIKVVPLVYEPRVNIVPRREPVSAAKLKVLYLGQVIARKGVIELTKAIEVIGTEHVRWTIVGGGDKSLLSKLDGFENVTVTGQVPRDQAAEYYQSHDVFILPTHSDGFAITQLEAMAYGLPVIASKMCGDVVVHLKTGLLLDDVSPASIVDSVQQLLDQPELLEEFRENISQRKFRTIDDLGNDLVSLFNE